MNKVQAMAGTDNYTENPPKPPCAALPTGDDRILEVSRSIMAFGATASYGVKWEVNGRPQTILPHPPIDYVCR